MNKKIKKWKEKFFKQLKKIKTEHLVKQFIKNNILFLTFLFTCVLNAILLRFFTMPTLENYLSFKPILADFGVVLLFGSFSFLFKNKNRFTYLLIVEIIFTLICVINSIYYTFYTSFASASMLSLAQFIAPVGDAVVENVLQLKDLVYIIGLIIFIAVHIHVKKKHYDRKEDTKLEKRKKTIKGIAVSAIVFTIFTISLTSLEMGRFVKQWNREYIVMRFGIYLYQLNDVFVSLQPKINSIFGYDQAKKNFEEYFSEKENHEENEYTNIFEGKNVIVIHGESIQDIAINRTFNGEEVTPTLNRLIREGLFFSNFYSEVSVGTSSDTELTFNTSLMPTKSGTAFVSYFDRTYNSTPKYFKEKGYYTFSMHANNADFWNRRAMHKSLGYDKFYSKETYDVDSENIIGLGLSDKSFFAQSVEKIKKIKEKEGTPFYGLLISLTNHTPFSDVEKYDPFDVDIKETVTHDDGTTETISHPYMEGTKLGNYFKSVHYADAALGEFLSALDEAGLLENTVFILYGDHDARLPKNDYIRLNNYDTATDDIKDEEDPTYQEYNSYHYELDRKVPLIIWTKDHQVQGVVENTMGMIDAMPTIGNMFGFENPYALGHDIFSIKDQNVVVFPNGNWITNKVYYNSQKGEYMSLKDEEVISKDYIEKNNQYAEKLLDVSNDMIVFDLLNQEKDKKEAK